MTIIDSMIVKEWVARDRRRWDQLEGSIAIGASERKKIWGVIDREVHFSRAGTDFVLLAALWRRYPSIDIREDLANEITTEIAAARRKAEIRVADRQLLEMLALEEDREARERSVNEESLQRQRREESGRRLDNLMQGKSLSERREIGLSALKSRYLQSCDEIRAIIQRRGITRLIHFTRAENLKGILVNGLVPRKDITPEVIVNDQRRLDGFTDFSCLSVEFPNYKYFYKQRQKSPGASWVVLTIDPEALCDHLCLFHRGNASRFGAQGFQELATAPAFENMFSPMSDGKAVEGLIVRSSGNVVHSHPCDPQAEILLYGRLSPRYIMEVIFPTDTELKKWLPAGRLDDHDFRVDSRYFRSREM